MFREIEIESLCLRALAGNEIKILNVTRIRKFGLSKALKVPRLTEYARRGDVLWRRWFSVPPTD